MALKNYSLLVGRASELAFDDDSSPHIEVRIEAQGVSYRIAINVRSAIQPHALLYARFDPWQRPELTGALGDLDDGLYDLRDDRPELALDYVRSEDMIEKEWMEVAPYRLEGPNNDLREFLVPLLEAAIAEEGYRIYAFGESWGPEPNTRDKYFGFLPGNGIHDIHMNQGSAGRFAKYNGIHQDGGLVVQAPDGRWIAIFLAFQSQSWETDEHGNATGEVEQEQKKLGDVGILAALVNPWNPETGRETVTLFNRSDGVVDLAGWKLVDGKERSETLDGFVIGPGDTLRLRLTGQGAILTNDGTELSLVEPGGAVAHQVSYRKKDLGPEGWSVIF